MFNASCLGVCLVEQGKLDEAQEVLDRAGSRGAVPDNVMGIYLLLTQGGVLLAAGSAEAALSVLREVADRARGWMDQTAVVLPYRSLLAFALAQLGEVKEARKLAAEELELARAFGAPRAVGIALCGVARVAEGGDRIGLLHEASEVLDDSGAHLERARARAALGAALRGAGAAQEAREPLREAIDLAHRCGAHALEDAALAELRATGARPRRRVTTGAGALTPSERRIAELAAGGQQNREIAEALFVTTATVEFHLRNAYRKLGVASRTQLADALRG
jgi:DNA-binding CsgD family transcriptional regulator